MVHSGRQLGARPIKFGKQEHAGVLPITLHCEFGPQGEGKQGLLGGTTRGSKKTKIRKRIAEGRFPHFLPVYI